MRCERVRLLDRTWLPCGWYIAGYPLPSSMCCQLKPPGASGNRSPSCRALDHVAKVVGKDRKTITKAKAVVMIYPEREKLAESSGFPVGSSEMLASSCITRSIWRRT